MAANGFHEVSSSSSSSSSLSSLCLFFLTRADNPQCECNPHKTRILTECHGHSHSTAQCESTLYSHSVSATLWFSSVTRPRRRFLFLALSSIALLTQPIELAFTHLLVFHLTFPSGPSAHAEYVVLTALLVWFLAPQFLVPVRPLSTTHSSQLRWLKSHSRCIESTETGTRQG